MSNEKQLKEEIHRVNEELKSLDEKKEAQEHENKKALLEANTKLDFQTERAKEYEEKYKAALQYKNQEESLKELDEQLRDKQNQIIRLMRLDHDKSTEAQNMLEETEQLKVINLRLASDLDQIKEAALNAIIDKDTTISELSEKLEEYESSDNINNLKAVAIELQEKYQELEDKLENNRIEYIGIIEGKDEEINEIQEKIAMLKDKNEDRILKLEQEIIDYEKVIEEVTAERDHDQNFEEKYYHTEEKLRKTEKRILEFEHKYIEERNELVTTLEKLEVENEALKNESGDLKEARDKVLQFEKVTDNIKNEWDEHREKYEKAAQDNGRRISHIESEKKIISDNLRIKVQEIDRLKTEIDERARNDSPSMRKEVSSPQKIASEDNSGLIDKLKKQNKDLEEANESLKRKIEEQTKELQESRQKLLQARGSESGGEANKLKVQIEELTCFLKKVENDMLMKKITHAEDENFWSIKEKKYKQEVDNLNKKYRKENSELLERIDRMKRLVPKDKKSDYYQSGFK